MVYKIYILYSPIETQREASILHRKGLVIGILILLIGVNIGSTFAGDTDIKSISSVDFDGNTLYVGGSGPNNYTTIQSAIDDAVDGDTVFVSNGTYSDSPDNYDCVRIDKRINLIGEDKYNTIIDGTEHLPYCVVRVRADGVTISGFTIQYNLVGYHVGKGLYISHPTGLDVLRNISIHDNIVKGTREGIWVATTCDSKFYNNIISDNELGISLSTGKIGSIYENRISNNKVGINIRSEGGYIYHNQITDNKRGIYAENTGAKISFNNFINNTIHALSCVAIDIYDIPVLQTKRRWNDNYWDNWSSKIPKPIMGFWIAVIWVPFHSIWIPIPIGPFPWINFDWHPAQEPYDIGA